MEQPLDLQAPRPVKLTVDDFLLLAEAGALDSYCRTELVEGVIVEMSPMGTRHQLLTGRLLRQLEDALATIGSPLVALPGPTITLPPHDAPIPDVLVLRLTDDQYASADTTILAVEIAWTTLRRDLAIKARIYARGGVPELWVVNGEGGQVHQFWRPEHGGYAETRVVPLAGRLDSATLAGLAVDGGALATR